MSLVMVQVYDGILPIEVCDYLINLFEMSEGHEFVDENHRPCFTQVNINQHHPDLVRPLIPYVRSAYQKYISDTGSKYLPNLKFLEEFRIKRYNVGGDERFDEHVDVMDHESAKRVVSFLFYLNGNDGSTKFTDRVEVVPKEGRVVVFPPTWEYPHSGLPPKNKTKYIMSTYIHYG